LSYLFLLLKFPAHCFRIPILNFIGLTVLLIPILLHGDSLEGDDLLSKAQAEFNTSNFLQAEKLVREFVRDQPDHVAALFLLGITLAKQERWSEAGETLEKTIVLQPDFVSGYLELAGVRHKEGARQDAIRLLRTAIMLDSENSYGRNFLATLAYLENHQMEALHHWNIVGEPRINEIKYVTPSKTSPELIEGLFRLNEGEVLRRERIMNIRWIQERLQLKTDFYWVLQPLTDDQRWDLQITLNQKNSLFFKRKLLIQNIPRIAFNQEIIAEFQSTSNQSFGGLLRWDEFRKKAMLRSAFPFILSGSDILHIEVDFRDEAWRQTESDTDFSLKTTSLSGNYEHAFRDGRQSLSLHAGYRHQDFRFEKGTFPSKSPHVAVLGLGWKQRFDLNEEDSRQLDLFTRMDQITLLNETHKSTYRLTSGFRMNWLLREQKRTRMVASLRAGLAGKLLPLDNYFSLGIGPDSPLALRAHPTLHEGRRGFSPIGREFALANVELSQQLFRWKFLRVDGFLFIDSAFVGQSPFGSYQNKWFNDVGGGVRLMAFGQNILHLVLGWDLKTSSFNQWAGLPIQGFGGLW